MLVMASIANHQQGKNQHPSDSVPVSAGNVQRRTHRRAVQLCLPFHAALDLPRPAILRRCRGLVEALRGLLMSMVSNLVDALLNAKLYRDSGGPWSGFALRHGNETTKPDQRSPCTR